MGDLFKSKSAKLREENGVPEKLEYICSSGKGQSARSYKIEIYPSMRDFKNECGERIYAKVKVDEVFFEIMDGSTNVKYKKIFSDKFLLTKGDARKTFRYNFSKVSGFTKNFADCVVGPPIDLLIEYEKNDLSSYSDFISG